MNRDQELAMVRAQLDELRRLVQQGPVRMALTDAGQQTFLAKVSGQPTVSDTDPTAGEVVKVCKIKFLNVTFSEAATVQTAITQVRADTEYYASIPPGLELGAGALVLVHVIIGQEGPRWWVASAYGGGDLVGGASNDCGAVDCASPAVQLAADEPCTCGAKVLRITLPTITGTGLTNIGGLRYLVYDAAASGPTAQIWESSDMTRNSRVFVWRITVPVNMQAYLQLIETSATPDVNHMRWSLPEAVLFCCCCGNKFVADCGSAYLPLEWNGFPTEICAVPIEGDESLTDAPECYCEGEQVPTAFSVAVAGITGTFSGVSCSDKLNATHIVQRGFEFGILGRRCGYASHQTLGVVAGDESGVVIWEPEGSAPAELHLVFGDAGVLIDIVAIYKQATVAEYNCNGENIFTLNSSEAACANYPATITAIPAYGVIDPETGEFIDTTGTMCVDNSCGAPTGECGTCAWEVQLNMMSMMNEWVSAFSECTGMCTCPAGVEVSELVVYDENNMEIGRFNPLDFQVGQGFTYACLEIIA